MQTDLKSLPNESEKLKAIISEIQLSYGKKLEEVESNYLKKVEEVKELEARIRLLTIFQYGRRSEKFIDPSQGSLFNEVEVELDSQPAEENGKITVQYSRRPGRGKRRPLPDFLDREEIVYDLAADQKFCPTTGKPLYKIGEKVSEQLDIIPATIKVLKHRRIKYACRCCDGSHMLTASMPKQAISKSMASAGLLSYIAVSKYADALPLYRQEQMFSRMGIDLTRATMARWMIQVAEVIRPLINLMKEDLLAGGLIHADETTVQVLKEDLRPASSKSYMWVLARGSPNVVLFEYHKTRSAKVASSILSDFQGYLMVDGYDGYNATSLKEGVTRLGCWAHARRYFFQAEKSLKGDKRNALCMQAMHFIRQLYKAEKESRNFSLEERHAHRREHAKPVVEEIRRWLDENIDAVTPSSLTGKAMNYLDRQWPYLSSYLEAGSLPIDNNYIENLIRPYVIGRKNWLFADTPVGADASANIYSLLVTAKLNKIEPYMYLRHVLKELPKLEDLKSIENLLPYNLKKMATCLS